VINKEAVKKVIKAGLALNCQIAAVSKFDRKNYFYPDLPKGYQISQYDKPFCEKGFLKILDKRIRITRVHLEEDTGRLIHQKGSSLVDFNRAGIPLMELVTEPDITSAQQARKFAQELQLILRYLELSEANMEKGQMRVEANISLKKGSKLGTKVEIKNLNSFKAVEKAIEHEIERQTELLGSGKKVLQETRGWNEIKELTFSQRTKEGAHDYRYFPEPDLPQLTFIKEYVDKIRSEIPELPQSRRERLIKEYGLDKPATEFFVQNKDLGEYFEQVISELAPNLPPQKLKNLITLSTNYIISDLQGLMKKKGILIQKLVITPENFAEFISLIESKIISSKIAKTLLSEMFQTGADPSHIIEQKGLTQIKDGAEIGKIVKEVFSENQKAVSDFRKGKQAALQFLIGKVMAKTKGRIEPQTAQKIIEAELQR
jgi:aspartyl-tRNA(Asn)/glutamyl-tRNA(Gln) amidotransferase subunit B